MGVFIHMSISKSVTKSEWKQVYEESLQLIKAFPLAERRKVKCKGIDTICLVPTVEREETYGWNNEKKRRGWFADGDYETFNTAEEYSLYKDMIQDDAVERDAGDALLGVLSAYLDYEWEDPRCNHSYDIWGAKTQGRPYHMYLLAIACLIESRLKEKAFVYGDITRGQCKSAVELANTYLVDPIDVPDRCDIECFYRRVSKLHLNEKERFVIFNELYLGTKDSEYGEYIRSKYREEVFDEYWKEAFRDYRVGTIGFDDYINEYLLWGFDLRKLCRIVNYFDKDKAPQYEKFIKRIMDTKLHLKKKNCDDKLKIDQEESTPYSIYTLMAQFAFAGARNKKVDRYIPIDEIKKVLIGELGDKCEVECIIEEYLQEEKCAQEINLSKVESESELEALCRQDASEVFDQMVNIKEERFRDNYEKYDINTYEDLMYYESGDRIRSNILDSLKQSFVFYNSMTEEKSYKKLMRQPVMMRCRWLVEQNRSILIRDIDWNKIFTDMEENEQSFSRYYPMMRVKLDDRDLIFMTIAIVLNDELYAYCKEFVEEK